MATMIGTNAFDLIAFSKAIWGVYESAYYANERGVLGPDEYVRFEQAICRNYQLDHSQWISKKEAGGVIALSSLSKNLTPKFRYYVEDLCK